MKINLEQAIQELNNDKIVAIPTETVYGLAAKIDSQIAINSIFETKKRPFFDPLIVHISSIEMGKKYANWTPIAEDLAKAFWPGPLTIILEKKDNVSDLITSGLSTVGLRTPQHPLALELISNIDTPLCAPSANIFGKTSPTNAEHVEDEFKSKVSVLDGGQCIGGIESTIIEIKENQINILRPGLISKEQIEKICELPVEFKEIEHIPGGLENHYQPEIPLIVFENNLNLDKLPENLKNKKYYELKLANQPEIVAREIYSKLRLGSKSEKGYMILENFKDINNMALRNRLLKASSFVIL